MYKHFLNKYQSFLNQKFVCSNSDRKMNFNKKTRMFVTILLVAKRELCSFCPYLNVLVKRWHLIIIKQE